MDKYERKRTENFHLVLNLINACTSSILSNIEDEEQQFQLLAIQKHVENYCNLDIEYEKHKSIMELTKNMYSLEPSSDVNVVTVYDKLYTEHTIPKININTHKFMIQFKENINKNNVIEEGFLTCDTFITPVDPITKNRIINPVKNLSCGHVYESDTIKHLIKTKKIKCPYMGCSAVKYITLSDLQEDTELKQKIENHK